MLKRAFANLAGKRGISHPTPKTGATLPFLKLWDEEEEEEIFPLQSMKMVPREPITTEGPSPIMDDMFGELHLEGHKTKTTFLKAAEGQKS